MKFASTRLIAADIKGMVAFYEMVTRLSAAWLAPVFAEIVTPVATLAIGSAETVALWKAGSAEPGANRTASIEFQVEDIDADYERLEGQGPTRARTEADALGEQDVSVPRPRRHGGLALHAGDRRGEEALQVEIIGSETGAIVLPLSLSTVRGGSRPVELIGFRYWRPPNWLISAREGVQ